jgi:hypothetical protein
MSLRRILAQSPLFLVTLAATLLAEDFTGKVVGIADGDTIRGPSKRIMSQVIDHAAYWAVIEV